MTNYEQYLEKASFRGDIEKAKKMLQLGTSVNKINSTGDTPLHLAIQGNQLAMVKWLCEQTADIYLKNNAGKNALIEALFSGCDAAIIDFLIMQGAVFDDDRLRRAYHGDVTVLEDSSLDTVKDSTGHSILHYAIAGHHLELVKKIKEKLDTTEGNQLGQTALHIAIRCNDLPISQWLQQNGYDPSVRDANDRTAFLTACQCGRLEIAQKLLEENKEVITEKRVNHLNHLNALHEAAQHNQLAIVKWLIINNLIDPLAEDWYGAVALHHAASEGFLKIVQWLVKETKSNNALTIHAVTPLADTFSPVACALNSGNEDIIKWLISENHIKIEADISLYKTLLQTVCAYGNLEFAKWLVKEGGANVNQVDYWGLAPLHLTDDIAMIEWLIDEANADMFAKINSYQEYQVGSFIDKTPLLLHISFLRNHYQFPTDEKIRHPLIKALLTRGAGINENFSGIDYLDYLDMTDCVLIGATVQGVPLHCQGAIHNNQELLEAITSGVELNVKALQKAVNTRLLQYPDDKELIETQVLLNKFAPIMICYNLNPKEAYALSKPRALPWIMQGRLSTLFPVEIIINIAACLMRISYNEADKIFHTVHEKLFNEKVEALKKTKYDPKLFSQDVLKQTSEYKEAEEKYLNRIR